MGWTGLRPLKEWRGREIETFTQTNTIIKHTVVNV